MNLEKFCKFPNEITADQAIELNKDLSTKSLDDIPPQCHSLVEEYLCSQLFNDGVRSELIPAIDELIEEIRAIEK